MFKVGDIVTAINKPGWPLSGLTGKVLINRSNYDDLCLVNFGVAELFSDTLARQTCHTRGEYYVNPELLRLDKGQMRKDKLNQILK